MAILKEIFRTSYLTPEDTLKLLHFYFYCRILRFRRSHLSGTTEIHPRAEGRSLSGRRGSARITRLAKDAPKTVIERNCDIELVSLRSADLSRRFLIAKTLCGIRIRMVIARISSDTRFNLFSM